MTKFRGLLLFLVLVPVALAQNPQQATGGNSPATASLQREKLTNQIAEAESHLAVLGKQVTALNEQVAAVESQLTTLFKAYQITALNEQIAAVETQLAALQKAYKESFPEIRDLKTQIQTLQNQRDALLK